MSGYIHTPSVWPVRSPSSVHCTNRMTGYATVSVFLNFTPFAARLGVRFSSLRDVTACF